MSEIPETLITKLREWLGPRNLRWFRLLLYRYQTVSPVLNLNFKRKHIPIHPVHFREGMQIRNFLREQPECAGWSDDDFDNRWSKCVEAALVLSGVNQ